MVLSSERMIAFFPEVDPRRHVLFDTMTDLIAGVVGTTIGGTVLFFYLYFKNRKSRNNK
jgi:Na+-transporting methylmalonyl-CoA/oxaloacetate decarboxylase beta subunit